MEDDIEYYSNEISKLSVLKLIFPEFVEEVETSLKYKDLSFQRLNDFIDANVIRQ